MAFLFQQYQTNTLLAVRSEIQTAIETSEPRISLNTVLVERDELDPQNIAIAIQYQIKATGQRDSLSFQVKP
jgi:predicted component of type VI protein secretion system